jgi:hypothetical protein
MDHQSRRHDGIFPNHFGLDGDLAWLESLGPGSVQIRSANGLHILAVSIEPHPDPADAAHHGWPESTKHAEARAEHDLEINIKAEQEIEVILHHLEHQNEILMTMLRNLGVDVHELMETLAR